jgi:hypothetical protein
MFVLLKFTGMNMNMPNFHLMDLIHGESYIQTRHSGPIEEMLLGNLWFSIAEYDTVSTNETFGIPRNSSH